jgi:tetratricopeptide (TPR) repeat protein
MLIFFFLVSSLLVGEQASLGTAAALIQQGRYREARSELLQATERHPDSAEAFALLGVAEIQLHEPAAARKSLEHALKLNPRSTNALYNIGVLSLDENRATEALTYFEKAGRLGYSSPELAVNLVRAHFEAGDNRGALKAVEDAWKQFPDSAAVYLALGNSLLVHGQAAEAAASLKKADSLAPSQSEILLPLADACLDLSEMTCADDALARVRSTSEQAPEFHFLSGRAALLAHREKEGLRELETAVEKEPNNVKFRIELARYDQKFGYQENALAEYKAAGQLAPKVAEIPYGLAVSYFIKDDFAHAIEFANKAIELKPKFDRAIFLLGISRFATNQLKQAEELLDEALRLRPGNAFYHCFQGMIQLSADHPTEASSNFREAIRLEPSYALAHFQMGRMLMRMKNYSEARNELERAVSLQPDLGEAYYQLGSAYRQLGDAQKASEAFAHFKQFRDTQQEERTEILKQMQETIQGRP